MFFKIVVKVFWYFGYFSKKMYCQELSKIAQSGHTGLGSQTKWFGFIFTAFTFAKIKEKVFGHTKGLLFSS